jgi:hypothetical protein
MKIADEGFLRSELPGTGQQYSAKTNKYIVNMKANSLL